jgi:hypothetical protein
MSNNGSSSPHNPKSIKTRLIFMSGLLLISCLFLVKFDLRLSNTFIYNIFNSLIDYNISNSTFAIAITKNTTQNITNNTSQEINKNISLTNVSKTIENFNLTEQPKEAFVTFCNNQPTYLALLKVLLDSIHAFSTRHIIAFGIDVDLNVNTKEYPRLIIRRISQHDCGPVIYIYFLLFIILIFSFLVSFLL